MNRCSYSYNHSKLHIKWFPKLTLQRNKTFKTKLDDSLQLFLLSDLSHTGTTKGSQMPELQIACSASSLPGVNTLKSPTITKQFGVGSEGEEQKHLSPYSPKDASQLGAKEEQPWSWTSRVPWLLKHLAQVFPASSPLFLATQNGLQRFEQPESLALLPVLSLTQKAHSAPSWSSLVSSPTMHCSL